MDSDKGPIDLWHAWRDCRGWQARRDTLLHRVDVSLEVACAERVLPEYLPQARLKDPDRARACEAVMPALWDWCAQPENSGDFDLRLAEAFWQLPHDDEDEMWAPELDGAGEEAWEVIAAACRAPLQPKFRDRASNAAYDFVQHQRAAPAVNAAFQQFGNIGHALETLLDSTHFRMAEIAVQDAALELAENRGTALTADDARALEARTGELLAQRGPQMASLYRDLLQTRADSYLEHGTPPDRRGAVILLIECAHRTDNAEQRHRILQRAHEVAVQLHADDLTDYVRAHS